MLILPHHASQMTVRIVCTVGRTALISCLRCLSSIPAWSFSPAGRAEKAGNPQDDDKKTSFAAPLAYLCRRHCFSAAGQA
jgi:hypothetical protein